MKLFKKFIKNLYFGHKLSEECNDFESKTLEQEVGDKIKKAHYAPKLPSEHFAYSLRAKILAQRHANKFFMDKVFSFINIWFAPKRLAPVVAGLVIISLTVNLLPYQGVFNPFREFSRLIISPAYAMDNFTLEPEVIDSLGVADDSSYILKSKEVLDSDLIRESLQVEPAVDYTLEQVSDKEWKIKPKNSLPANTIFKVSLKTSFYATADRLESRDYSWAYQVKDNFRILTHIPGNQTTGVPTDSGIEITFSHDNFKDYDKYITIEPTTAGRFEKNGRMVVFVADKGLANSTIYTVTIKAGLPLDGSDFKLAEDYSFRFETEAKYDFNSSGQVYNYFNIYERFLEFNTKEKPIVQVYANNDSNAKVNISVFNLAGQAGYLSALKKADQIPWWAYSRDVFQFETSGLEQVASFATEVKKGQYVQFVDFPDALPAGYYVVNFNYKNIKRQIWFQVTDLSAYINITKTDTIVWVNNSSNDKAIVGAQVRILGENTTYTTNSQGVATFVTPKMLVANNEDAAPNYLEITSGDKKLIMPATFTSRSYSYSSVSTKSDYWNYLYTDRPKYQPTDTIKFFGLIKKRDQSSIKEKVKLVLTKEGYVDYYYNPINVTEYEVNISDLGTFSGEIKLDGLRPDYYRLTLSVGDISLADKYIEIRPYIKPAYQLSMTPDKESLFVGGTVNLDIQASFFDGTPVAGLPLVFKMPEGDYQTTVDDQGQAHLTYTKKYSDCQNYGYRCWPDNTYLRIEPKDPEMSEIGAEVGIQWFGPSVWAQIDTTYPEAGIAELAITARRIDLSSNKNYFDDSTAKLAPNAQVSGEITKITYKQIVEGNYYDFISKKVIPRYRYDRQEESAGNFSGITDKDGRYVIRRTIEPETNYRIDLKVGDETGKYDNYNSYLYYYDGYRENNYNDYNNNYYSLEMPVGKTYSVGDRVTADMSKNKISLPDDDGSQYLFLQLQNGLQEYKVSNSSLYTFNFETRDIPNVNLVGVRFKNGTYFAVDSDYYSSNQAIFKNDDKNLDITIKSDKQSYQPGEDATLSIIVKNKDGQPVPAAINVNVVDEAYYAVADDTADPLSQIYSAIGGGSYYSRYSHKSLSDVAAVEKGGCFLAGTKILLADGTTKPIEDIVPGDKIKTFSDPLRLVKGDGDVAKIFSHRVNTYLIINGILRVTPEHLIYSDYSFREAGLLKVGDWLLQADGRKVSIETIEIKHEPVMVYNFTVEPHHTYIADNFYVHNEKGGGVRDYFVDAPLFRSIMTDNQGRAEVKFTLPDNITTWRTTVQAISNDLEAGAETAPLKVTKGVFADITVGNEYLVADQPIVRLRAFGTALNRNDAASFKIKVPSLNLTESGSIKTTAFQSAYLSLPTLKVGKHDITYSLTTARGNDVLKLPINVITSNLSIKKLETTTLTTDTKITSPNGDPVTVLLGDQQRIQLIDPLENLSWSWGDRIDQLITRQRSQEILNKILSKNDVVPKVEANLYQQPDGGIALLPYGQSDPELSIKLAYAAADKFDKESLRQYFLSILNNKDNNREQVTLSITGLAVLQTPILPLFNNWRVRQDLSAKEKMYLALAAHSLGADELARDLYYQVVKVYAQEKLPEIIIRVNDNNSETWYLTALTAIVASDIGASERDGLWASVRNFNGNKDVLLDIEKLMYLQSAIPRLHAKTAKVTYEINGRKQTMDFSNDPIQFFGFMPADLPNIHFTEVIGDVAISIITEQPATAENVKKDNDFSIKREYFVNNRKTNTFKENDLIEVRLYPQFSTHSLVGDYQIIDILPNGLLPVTKFFNGYYDTSSCRAWYPYNIDGKKVKYTIWKEWKGLGCNNYISYFARVKTRGKYQAEPALLQSLVNPDYVNFTDNQTITIE